MMQKLTAVALEDHSKYDCFVCCILSHGELDCVSGINGLTVKISKLMTNLQARSCPSLAGKPKLFFIQACQGDKKIGLTKVLSDATKEIEREFEAVGTNRSLNFYLRYVYDIFYLGTNPLNQSIFRNNLNNLCVKLLYRIFIFISWIKQTMTCSAAI